MKTYSISYDYTELARVTIEDTDTAREAIKEMVEFWMGWEERLKEAKGDYTQCWLKQLGRFLLRGRGIPGDDDEGWYALDGSNGIVANEIYEYEMVYDDIEVEEVK